MTIEEALFRPSGSTFLPGLLCEATTPILPALDPCRRRGYSKAANQARIDYAQ
jgi:hypothetical protein